MNYKDLQKQAKKLGLRYVGVSSEDLKQSIEEAQSSETKPEKSSKEPKKVSEDADAVVYNGKHKVRTYTLERHGENYTELANQFVSHPERRGYKVKFETVETRLLCPHCGKKFRYN